jgi:hypothetical protein
MLQDGPKFIPLRLLVVEVAFNDLLRPSTTKRKRSGDRGHPFLIPCSYLKKGDVDPFRRMDKGCKLIQLRTHMTKAW